LLTSYFDILFAINYQPHPGEKRLVEFAVNHCKLLPQNIETDITSILQLTKADIPNLPMRISHLLDQLDQLLVDEGLI